jgi:hypothetical protein
MSSRDNWRGHLRGDQPVTHNNTDGSSLPNLDALADRLPGGLAKELVARLKNIGSQEELTKRLTEQLAARVDFIEREARDASPEVA